MFVWQICDNWCYCCNAEFSIFGNILGISALRHFHIIQQSYLNFHRKLADCCLCSCSLIMWRKTMKNAATLQIDLWQAHFDYYFTRSCCAWVTVSSSVSLHCVNLLWIMPLKEWWLTFWKSMYIVKFLRLVLVTLCHRLSW